ncbi:hypothetical protein KAH94_05605 [bacterium]|nr:hypothetical protein [bacterium]
MKFFRNDVVLLLGFLLLFCFGLGFLRNDSPEALFYVDDLEPDIAIESDVEVKVENNITHEEASLFDYGYKKKQFAQDYRDERLTDLTTDQLIRYMKPLFMTKSASAITSFLKHIPRAGVFRVVKAIVQDRKIHLPRRVKLRIIFAGAQRQCSKKQQAEFFNLIVSDKLLKKGVKPVLVKAVETGYSHLVPDILEWANRTAVGDLSLKALQYAARHDDEDPECLRELFEAGVKVDSKLASQLLVELVDFCTEGYSISFLIRVLRANANCVSDFMTVLMRAVKSNKTVIVAELLKNGANPKITGKNVSNKTAMHIAKDTGNVKMQNMLKESRMNVKS